MKIKLRTWIVFSAISILCLFLWHKFEYPRFAFVNLSFDKEYALSESEKYLKGRGADISGYSRAVVFDTDEKFNRYFQHAAGIKAEEQFIKRYDFDLFCWIVRFFKEYQKEEYLVYVSPASGKVIRFYHLIEDTETRADMGEEASRNAAESFLQETFHAHPGVFDFHEEKIKHYENRTEYVFSWERKGVYIPWKGGEGGAKLLTEVTVSGNRIREFCKNKFDIPEAFKRYVEKQFILGEYLYGIFYILLFAFLGIAIIIVIKKRQGIVMGAVDKWFYCAAAFLFIINIADFFNNIQISLMAYPSSARLSSFLGLAFTRWLFNTLFLTIGFIMPGIAGESLCSEVFPGKKYLSFLDYIKSGFMNRSISGPVMLGYLIWIIALGLQASIFYAGQGFLGVWREYNTMTYFSSGYLPLLGALVIGASASLNEEINFRLFGITLAKKYLRSSALAILLTSLIWGMGHTLYVIFPVWFRIVEISIIGIFYGLIFLRFGIIPLIVAHYLFDVFWCSSVYLLGRGNPHLFFSSVFLLGIPLFIAAAAYFLNRKARQIEIGEMLDRTQIYNLDLLAIFIAQKISQGYSAETIKKELIEHNWDHLLVELALKKVFSK